MKKLLILLGFAIIISANNSFSQNTLFEFTSSSSTNNIPSGVNYISVELWGAGGCGSRAQNGVNNNRAGGGGGAYVRSVLIPVSPSQSFSYTVGNGGVSNSSNLNGGSSTFTIGSITLTANGGSGLGNNVSTGGSGGSAATIGGNVAASYSGGNGGNADALGSGGGGGGAGSDSNGNNGGNSGGNGGNGGIGNPGTPNNGRGGNGGGGLSNAEGDAGKVVGGGGAGGRRNSVINGGNNGGNGANGRIIVRKACDVTPVTPTLTINNSNSCYGINSTLTAENITLDPGIEFKWQESTNNGLTWSDLSSFEDIPYWLPSTTALTYQINPLATTLYRFVTRCSVAGTEVFSNSVTRTINCWQSPTNTTVTTCTGKFFDSGGPGGGGNNAAGNYANNQNYTYTFFPSNTGDNIRLNFNSFATEEGYDALMIYDGPNVTSPLISSGKGVGLNATTSPAGSWRGENNSDSPGIITSTHSSGAITIVFRSDNTENRAGWDVDIVCVPKCSNSSPATLAISDPGGCAGFATTLFVTNLIDEAGNQLKLQSSTDNGATWSDVTQYEFFNSTTSNFTISPSVNTQYRILTRCIFSSTEAISNIVTRGVVSCFTALTPGPGTYNVPNEVSCVKVQVWGAGGGGGRSEQDGRATGGGGGGAFVEGILNVTGGGSIPYFVGAGGLGSAGPNGGGATWFSNSSTINAAGGSGVAVNGNAGGAGGVGTFNPSLLTNAVAFNGGNGGNGSNGAGSGHSSGAGGGGAGSSGNGGAGGTGINTGLFSGINTIGGIGASVGGGNGGIGMGSEGTGGAGGTYGGGGGGGKRASLCFGCSSRNGGNGADGALAIITPVTAFAGTVQSAPTQFCFASNPTINIDFSNGVVSFGNPSYNWYYSEFNQTTSNFEPYASLGITTEDLLNFDYSPYYSQPYPTTLRLMRRTYSSCGSEGYPNFVDQELFVDIIIEDCESQWIGGISNDWNTAGNWSSNSVPLDYYNVTIPQVVTPNFNPVIFQAVEVNDLTINNGGILQVDPGASITVNGLLTNNGTFNIESDGYLVQTVGSALAGNGTFSVKRTLTGMSGQGARFLGSPINNSTAVGIGLSSVSFNGGNGQLISTPDCNPNNSASNSPWSSLLRLNESLSSPNDCYVELWEAAPLSTTLTNGRGYQMWVTPNSTLTFTGTVNNGSVQYNNLPRTPGSVGGANQVGTVDRGWHLVSNPYPSPIVITGNTDLDGMNFEGQIQRFSTSSGTQGVWVPNNPMLPSVIAPGQAFQIKTKDGQIGNWQLDNSYRTASTATFFNNDDWCDYHLDVTMTHGNVTDFSSIYFISEATEAFDTRYDANRWKSVDRSTLFTLSSDNKELGYNAQPLLENIREVPMNLQVRTSGEYNFDFSYMETFDPSVIIFLIDHQTGSNVNLREQSHYTFNANIGDAEDRFTLKFYAPLQINTSLANCENLGVISVDGNGFEWNYSVVDVTETVVQTGQLESIGETYIALQPGIYALNIQLHNSTYAGTIENIEVLETEIPVANFNVSTTEAFLGDVIEFFNTSENYISQIWNFGDNNTSFINNPIHFYSSPGWYDVTLNVSSSSGCSSVKHTNVWIKGNSLTIEDDLSDDSPAIGVYGYSQTLYINIPSTVEIDEQTLRLNIISLDGKLNNTYPLVGKAGVQEILTDLADGIYLVQIIDKNQIHLNTKVFLNK